MSRLVLPPTAIRRTALVFVGSAIHGELSVVGPRLVSFPCQVYPSKMASNYTHIAVLSADGVLFCGGNNRYGQLSCENIPKGPTEEAYDPFDDIQPFQRVEFFPFSHIDFKIVDIATGYRSTAAITNEGHLFLWGTLSPHLIFPKPSPQIFPKGHKVIQVALGFSHALALADTNGRRTIFSWGESNTGALGLPETSIPKPTEIPFFNKFDAILSIVAGYDHSGAIVDDRNLYVFGNCEYKKNESEYEPFTPRVVCFLEPGRSKIDLIHMGKEITLIVIEGLVFTWGTGFQRIVSFGEQKDEESSKQLNSTIIPIYINKSDPAVSLSCSLYHISMTTDTGKCFALGCAKNGGLGTGNCHENFAMAHQVNTGHPARSVAVCNGSSYFFVVPPIIKVSLDHIMQFECAEIPFITEFLIHTLSQEHHCCTEGIFRTSGATKVIEEMLHMFSIDKIDERIYSQPTDSYTGLLKHFLRTLSSPLIPVENQIEFCDIMIKEKNSLGRMELIYVALQKLPKNHHALFKKILLMLHRVVSFSDKNKMTTKNVVMCFLTAIFGQHIMSNIQRATGASSVLNILIRDAPIWFEEKEKLIPVEMRSLLVREPFLQSVTNTLFLCNHSLDIDLIKDSFLKVGVFRELCLRALLGEWEGDDEWKQYHAILKFVLPHTVDVDSIYISLQSMCKLEPKLSLKTAESISVAVDYLAQTSSQECSTLICQFVKTCIQ